MENLEEDEAKTNANNSSTYASETKIEEVESTESNTQPDLTLDNLKSLHLKEITDLKNQLDEVQTRATIIETTKQDEFDELKFKTKQEIDSLNHIINALQTDLNTLRHDYEKMSENLKKHQPQQHDHMSHSLKSPVSQSSPQHSSALSRLNLSPFGSVHHQQQQQQQITSHNISQENESLEEDMRKAKESADMLRSVVLPLETEINLLRSRSNTNEQRVKDLEKIIEDNEKERKFLEEVECRLVSESLDKTVDEEIETFKLMQVDNKTVENYFNKYISLKKYLKNNEEKFIKLEQKHLMSIKQIYDLLDNEQKKRLIPKTRAKSKSLSSNTGSNQSSNPESNSVTSKLPSEEFSIEQNETISKIEELIDYLTLNSNDLTGNMSLNLEHTNTLRIDPSTESSSSSNGILTYSEMLALYEKEKNCRIDMETNFQQKAKEANKQIENLNREITNLSSIIEEMRKAFINLQGQFTYQMETLIKINEEIKADAQRVEKRNEHLKAENLKFKVENKQLYGEQTILGKELDEQYNGTPSTIDEAMRQINSLKAEMIKLISTNQALNRNLTVSSENIKHLTKVNAQYQRSNNAQDQLVITQSLESELQRERKVRIETETDKQELINQLKLVKEKSQSIIESLKQRNEQSEFEQRKQKEENQELINQIQSLKKDAKNSLSVQEDLVRLIQSLQIELNQTKTANDPQSSSSSDGAFTIEVRCQSEDDFNECASCKCAFGVTKRKHRCKHCCKIFCADCTSKTINSGPNKRPHKVCDSCHTLLDKHSTNTKS